jgi:hypothetical protein
VKSNSDRALERLLRQSLSVSASADATDSCLDTEVLAAWADGNLRGPQVDAVEQHVASCSRCQAIAATVVRTVPEPVVSREAGWRGWKFRWLAPVTAVIVIGMLATLLRNERSIRPASIEESPQRSAAIVEPPQDRALPQTPPAQPPPREGASSVARERDEVKNEARLEKEAGATAAPSPAAPPPNGQAAAEAPSGARRADAFDRAQSARGAIAQSLSESVAIGPEVSSPDGLTRWRISTPGSVQRSTDQGATWEVQSTGISMSMTAGSSPSPLVCWLVGRSGTVLLSTDGKTWQQVPFPESVDLAAVQAADARSAVITAADGRQFRTTNAGTSWQ